MLNILLICVLALSQTLTMFKRKEISNFIQGNGTFYLVNGVIFPVVEIDSRETPDNASESEEGKW